MGGMTQLEAFKASIEAFLTKSGMPASIFSYEATGDRSFVRDLRNGRNPTLGLVDRVNAFMASYEAVP